MGRPINWLGKRYLRSYGTIPLSGLRGWARQFRGIDKTERDARMACVIDVLYATELCGFASIVPVGAYREAFPHSKSDDPFFCIFIG
jgi:hypothetical protein